MVITPDGPRGPAYELGPGIVFLAQKSGAVGVANESGIFALLAAGKLGPLHHPATVFESAGADQPAAPVNLTGTPEEFEVERLRVQDAMMSMVEMR